jgi:hypothetical protein
LIQIGNVDVAIVRCRVSGADGMLADEHEKVLQLICFSNPVPDQWQPLLETCEGVLEQSSL